MGGPVILPVIHTTIRQRFSILSFPSSSSSAANGSLSLDHAWIFPKHGHHPPLPLSLYLPLHKVSKAFTVGLSGISTTSPLIFSASHQVCPPLSISLALLKPVGNGVSVPWGLTWVPHRQVVPCWLSHQAVIPFVILLLQPRFPLTPLFFLLPLCWSLCLLPPPNTVNSNDSKPSVSTTYPGSLFWCWLYAGSPWVLPRHLPLSPPFYSHWILMVSLCLFPPPYWATTFYLSLYLYYLHSTQHIVLLS